MQKNLQIYAKAELFNSDMTFPISSVVWTQISPVAVTENLNIFYRDGGGILLNTEGVVKIKMSAFNHMSEQQSVKLKVEVTNTNGDKAIDIREFFLNEAPFKTGTVFTNSGGTDDKEAMATNISISVPSWYDSIDDTVQNLEFRTYFEYNKKNYMITSWSSVNELTIQIPYFIELPSTKADISVCVQAKDTYWAMTSYCTDYANFLSNYQGNRDELILSMADLNMTDHDNMMKLSLYVNFLYTFMSFGEKTTDYSHPSSEDYV